MRTVICHYHIYKNSGTSFDALLTQNYGDRHVCFDGPFPFFTIDQEQLIRIIERKKDAVAFSSHQINLPIPASLDIQVIPAVFLRHPILRVLSIYRYKRKTFDGTETSKSAQETTFNEWVNYCFSSRQEITHISNAQTRMVGGTYREKSLMRRIPKGMEYDINQALRNLKNIQLLARTEYFNEDVARFPSVLKKFEIDFKFSCSAPKNTTGDDHDKTIDERLETIKKLLTNETYKKLVQANEQDMLLFNCAGELIEQEDGCYPFRWVS